jgi:YesN/AraC family two-component response regulator
VESAMLDAIRRGDIAEATYQQNLFMGFSLDQRVTDRLRDVKDMIIALNTLCRKAIQQAAVHPLYIDGISGQFVTEIESAENPEQVTALIPKMIRHYCLLVQQHSLARYSGTVRDCLNYIDFHYMEMLSLESLAARFSVNKNYLSARFHKEVGTTVTDYINQTRINRATGLLRHTALSVQQIAEQCGFADANYFTRTYKKIQGFTPNEYRKSIQWNGKKEEHRENHPSQ